MKDKEREFLQMAQLVALKRSSIVAKLLRELPKLAEVKQGQSNGPAYGIAEIDQFIHELSGDMLTFLESKTERNAMRRALGVSASTNES